MSPDDFSIVVQGPIHSSPDAAGSRDLTAACLASIRRFLPGAEIVLSTWKNERIEGLDYDRLIVSDDPGAVRHSETVRSFNNVNRQIVSTQAGLAAATRPFAVKFRGDLTFSSGHLLQLEEPLTRPSGGKFFRSSILLSPYHTRNPRRYPLLFHYGDIVQAGRIEDMRKLWDVPLAPEPELTRWREGRPYRFFAPAHSTHYLRVWPEQYLALSFLEKQGLAIFLDHPWKISARTLLLSEQILVENFCVIDLADFGVYLAPRLIPPWPAHHFIHARDWNRLAEAYASPGRRVVSRAALLARGYLGFLEFCCRQWMASPPVQRSKLYRRLRIAYRRWRSARH